MVKDRLRELYQTRPSLRFSTAELSPNNLQFVNTNEHFLQQIVKLNQFLNDIDILINQMLQVQDTILCQPIAEAENKQQLDFIINQIRKLIEEFKNNLKQFEIEQQQEIKLNIINISNVTRRINLNQIEQLKRRLFKIIEKFQLTREDYKKRITKRVKRQLELAGGYLNNNDIENLLKEKSEQIFYRYINPLNIAAHLALEEVSNRHFELIKLEKSIEELTECFNDMLNLINLQDSIINRIDKNIETSLQFTNQAKKQINKAEYFKGIFNYSNQYMLIIIIILVIIILVVLQQQEMVIL